MTNADTFKGGRIDARTACAIAVTLLFWSSAFAAIGRALSSYGPGELALFRFGVASVTLAIVAPFARIKLPQRRDLPAIVLLGFFGVAVYHVSLNFGQRTVSAGAASLIISTAPIFAALTGAIVLRERIGLRGWCGIGISFVGAALISLSESHKPGKSIAFSPNILLVFLAAATGAACFVFQKLYVNRYGALSLMACIIWIGTAFMLPWIGPLIREIRVADPRATWSVVYLGIAPTALAYVTWLYVLSRLPASRAATWLYLLPALAFVIAWVWLGETPRMFSVIGGVVAIAGIVLVNTRGGRKTEVEEMSVIEPEVPVESRGH